MVESYIVVGLRVEHYIGDVVTGGNCHFTYTPTQLERDVLLLVREADQQKIELSLWTEYGECGSGWCTASYGRAEHKEVDIFACKTHTCKPFVVSADIDRNFTMKTSDGRDVATCDYVGYDDYYPNGEASANRDIFTLGGVIDEVAIREFVKRPVLIFYGDSNACKSHIAALTGKTVYETDAHDYISSDITEDIIVIGNRHGYDVDCVRWNVHDLENANIIEVHFKHSDV